MANEARTCSGEKTVSSISGARKTGQLQNAIRTLFNSIYKNKLKWIKNFNVRSDTLKLHEENIGRTLFDINHSNIFLYLSPTVMEIKTKQTKSQLGTN